MVFLKRCSLELNEWEVRRRLKWLPRDSRLIFVREPNEHGWTTRWFALLLWDERQFITVPVLTQTFLVDSDGINHTWPTDATWNNANNLIEVIGGGGSGGYSNVAHGTGGGGGAYCSISNATLSGSITYRVGLGGTVLTSNANGIAGGKTWFNDTAFPTTGSNKVGADAGLGGVQGIGNRSGGAGGLIANNYPASTGKAGGRGGNLTGGSGGGGSGGGGAGGSTADGGQGVDSSSTVLPTTNGGPADVGGTGAGAGGIASGSTGGNGGNGTEFDGSHGSGGGGAGAADSTAHAGNGGNYGGGGGGVKASGSGSNGTGGLGIVALTWTPAVSIPMTDMAIFCMP